MLYVFLFKKLLLLLYSTFFSPPQLSARKICLDQIFATYPISEQIEPHLDLQRKSGSKRNCKSPYSANHISEHEPKKKLKNNTSSKTICGAFMQMHICGQVKNTSIHKKLAKTSKKIGMVKYSHLIAQNQINKPIVKNHFRKKKALGGATKEDERSFMELSTIPLEKNNV